MASKLRRLPFQATHALNDLPVMTLDGHCYTREEWEQGLPAARGEDRVFGLDAAAKRLDPPPHWWDAHRRALDEPIRFEKPILMLMDALEAYAHQYGSAYTMPVGDDGVLGDEWLSIARGLLGLLNGEHGRLDAGTIDRWVRQLAHDHGFEEEV